MMKKEQTTHRQLRGRRWRDPGLYKDPRRGISGFPRGSVGKGEEDVGGDGEGVRGS